MPATAPKTSVRFVINCEKPVKDQIFDTAQFEKYLVDRIKVNNRTNNFQEGGVTVKREGDKIVFATTSLAVSKRYMKYLTKKYLKKHQLKDHLRVVADSKDSYDIRYYSVGGVEEADEE